MKYLIRFSPVIAFLGYGSWATYVNYEPDSDFFILSGIIQGVYAFVSTLFLKWAILLIFHQFNRYQENHHYDTHSQKNDQSIVKWRAQICTYIISLVLLIFIPVGIHLLSGTVHVVAAIAPGVLIGSVYVALILRVN